MQVIIPVAGAGTRLRPLTYTQPKVLISVAGKPILSFIIDDLLESGITDFVFVIGYLGEKIREFVEKKLPQYKCPVCYPGKPRRPRPRHLARQRPDRY